MKLISITDQRRLPGEAPGLEGWSCRRNRLLAALRAAQIRAAEIAKYAAAVEIYRNGGCRLREVERIAIVRRNCIEPVGKAALAQPSRPEAVDAPSTANAVFFPTAKPEPADCTTTQHSSKDRDSVRAALTPVISRASASAARQFSGPMISVTKSSAKNGERR